MLVLTLWMAMMSGCATTADPPPRQPEIVHREDWLRIPTMREFKRVYPRDALRQGIGARVVLDCTVTAAGKLTDCAVSSETPQGYGFGAAALQLAPKFRMPRFKDGQSVAGGAMRLPIVFKPPAE